MIGLWRSFPADHSGPSVGAWDGVVWGVVGVAIEPPEMQQRTHLGGGASQSIVPQIGGDFKAFLFSTRSLGR